MATSLMPRKSYSADAPSLMFIAGVAAVIAVMIVLSLAAGVGTGLLAG